jgi:hypothetical protein
VITFTDYQTRLALFAIRRNPGADLVYAAGPSIT